MLNQNTKGFLTLLTITGIVSSVFYGYKGLIEPNLMRNAELFPVEIAEITITPKVEIRDTLASITWEIEDSAGGIKYANKKQDCIDKNNECLSIQAEINGTHHKAEILNLKEDTDYFYKIIVNGEEFPKEDEKFFSFKKPSDPKPAENTGPDLDPKNIHEAIKTQDLTYDLNGDGKVTIADLYMLNSKKPN
ncbi:hypothetical protein GW755_01845 [bacterium]|nr:hypothetical protein [bacterium]